MSPYRPKSPDEVHRNMSAIRSTGNRTEVALRSALHRAGLRFRIYNKQLIGKPDITFARARVAIFVDGDYWHARALREKGLKQFKKTLRTTMADYWLKKFQRRIIRDDEVTAKLRADGWVVLRYWESAVRADVSCFARRIAKTVRMRS